MLTSRMHGSGGDLVASGPAWQLTVQEHQDLFQLLLPLAKAEAGQRTPLLLKKASSGAQLSLGKMQTVLDLAIVQDNRLPYIPDTVTSAAACSCTAQADLIALWYACLC